MSDDQAAPMDIEKVDDPGKKRTRTDAFPRLIRPDQKDAVFRVYEYIRNLIQEVFPTIDKKIDHNAETMVTQIVNVLGDRKNVQIPQKMKIVANGILVDYILNDGQKKLLREISTNDSDLDRKFMFPILSSIQKMIKTREEIIYQNNSITQELGLPSWAEPLAQGRLVKDKLAKSRPKTVGPLIHVKSLKRLQGDRKVPMMIKEKISKQLIKTIKSQFISPNQRLIIDEFAKEDYSHLSLLVSSSMIIKPRLENLFVLHPLIMLNCDMQRLSVTNMSDESVFKLLDGFSGCQTFCPKEWVLAMPQIYIHMMFGTVYENLEVLDKVFAIKHPQTEIKIKFQERKEWGTWNRTNSVLSLAMDIGYNYWSKPQRAAPRSIGVGGSTQLASFPSLRGERRSFDFVDDVVKLAKTSVPSGSDLFEALKIECQTYKDYCKKEGTGSFYMPGSVVATDINVNSIRLFYGTPSKSV